MAGVKVAVKAAVKRPTAFRVAAGDPASCRAAEAAADGVAAIHEGARAARRGPRDHRDEGQDIALLALKFGGPILKTGGTMILSIGAYAMMWGWKYAVGFVLLIFVHELGHVIVAQQAGL